MLKEGRFGGGGGKEPWSPQGFPPPSGLPVCNFGSQRVCRAASRPSLICFQLQSCPRLGSGGTAKTKSRNFREGEETFPLRHCWTLEKLVQNFKGGREGGLSVGQFLDPAQDTLLVLLEIVNCKGVIIIIIICVTDRLLKSPPL